MSKSVETPRCAWCRRPLARPDGPGRPRRFCSRSHRQRAYEARRRADSLNLPEGHVIVTEEELQRLHDRLYRLEAAMEDVDADLSGRSGRAPTARLSSTSTMRRRTWPVWWSSRPLADPRPGDDERLGGHRPRPVARLAHDVGCREPGTHRDVKGCGRHDHREGREPDRALPHPPGEQPNASIPPA